MVSPTAGKNFSSRKYVICSLKKKCRKYRPLLCIEKARRYHACVPGRHSDARKPKTLHDEDIALAKDYIQCVNENIQAFLSNKPHVMQMDLETLNNDLPKLWRYINAKGNLESAITSTNIKHNTSQDYIKKKRRNRLKRFIPQKLLRKQI